MQVKQAPTCVVLIIAALNLTDGAINNSVSTEPPSDFVTDCLVEGKDSEYTISGEMCVEFPRGYPIHGTVLTIQASSIAELQPGDFIGLSTSLLKSMTIDMNVKLHTIGEGLFSEMQELENLTISNNERLMYIHSETFAGLVNLKQLVLSKNIYMDFYCMSQAVRPEMLPSLIYLDVSGNPFSSISYTDAYQMNSSTIRELKLSYCELASTEGTAFNNLPHLRTLYIDNNNLPTSTIIELIQNISQHSTEFREIHIGANNIKDPGIVFSIARSTKITHIDLSFTRFAPGIADTVYTVPDITYLDLSETRSRFPQTYFTPNMFPNLEYLLLNSNHLFSKPFFMSLPKLRYLDLSDNANANDVDSIFCTGLRLENMTSLEVLRLDNNPIPVLYRSAFQNLPSLKELYLTHTSIQTIEFAPFAGLDSLEILDLSHNPMNSGTINSTTFLGLFNLKRLILDNVMLTCLKDEETFIHTPKLEYLSLPNNALLELKHHLLFPLPQLNILDLSYNSFQNWDQRIFENNPNLETLLLSHNQISSFTSAMLQDFSGLKSLDLNGNVLSCGCSELSLILPYIKENNTNEQNALIKEISQPSMFCSAPKDLRFTSYWETAQKMQHHECGNYSLVFILVTIIILVIVIISIPTFYFLRWHIKYWIFLLRQALACYIFPKKKSPVLTGKYAYDAFVSYSNEDRGFVVRLVSMLENKSPRFRLCVYERDFAIGGVITSNVVESLAKSKRTILILSDAFARSTWCQWEMNLAQHKRLFFKDQNGPLIIIKIGEIMEKHMTPTLRYLTKTRIYLQWNADPIKQKVFWEKLRTALSASLDDDDTPTFQHKVLSNGETVNNNNTNISTNYAPESINV